MTRLVSTAPRLAAGRCMLAEHARAAPLSKSGPLWSWLCQNFDPFTPNVASHQSEAEQPPEAPDAKIAIASTSVRGNSQPHLACTAYSQRI